MLPSYYPGRRLSYESNLCTVRYVGQVQGTKGEWLGVEWDDPTRGKHNGKHGGVKYFDLTDVGTSKGLSSHSTPATFVRPSRPHDPPRNFVEAVRAKYVSENLVNRALHREVADSVITIGGKDVEEVGFDKIKRQLANLQALRIVVLDGLCIGRRTFDSDEAQATDSVVSSQELANGAGEACPNIVDLDLGRNLFELWSDISSIVTQLPKLSSLSISGNRLSATGTGQQILMERPPYSTLKTLSLESCLLKWQEIIGIARSFRSLESLFVGNNELSYVGADLPSAHLTQLSLDQNHFEYVNQLRPLTKLKNLQRLNLKQNRIHAIHETSARNDPKGLELVFPLALEDVDLSYNDISSWQFIDELGIIFPGMTRLRTSSNPLYLSENDLKDAKRNEDAGFILTVARLGRLNTLNFSKITPKGRLDAEAFYLSQIGKELSANPIEKAGEILSNHARYDELCNTFGDPVVIRKTKSEANPNSLGSRLISCTFQLGRVVGDSVNTPSAATKARPMWDVEIPESFTVYNVHGMVGKHFGLLPSLLKLIWETGEEEVASDDYDASGNGNGNDGQEDLRRNLREEVLEPRTRRIGTWLGTSAAKIRIESSEGDHLYQETARAVLKKQSFR